MVGAGEGEPLAGGSGEDEQACTHQGGAKQDVGFAL